MTQRVTYDLIRACAEHNNGEVSTLEELSMHQRNLVKIDLLDTACKDLKILYLQNNLIPRIEHVSRLRALEYVNLALNNVESCTGLEGCEMLNKLDLTVNFVGDARTIKCLQANRCLTVLYLTGNPCSDFRGYREYVLATLTQLQSLDGIAITKSERLKALQGYAKTEKEIIAQSIEYLEKRKAKKERKAARAEARPGHSGDWYTDTSGVPGAKSKKEEPKVVEINTDDEGSSGLDDFEDDPDYWEEATEHCPEERVKQAEYAEKQQMAADRAKGLNKKKKKKRKVNFETPQGVPRNMNEGGWAFELQGQQEPDQPYVLELEAYKHMDTSQLDLDVQPNYVRVCMKEKYFQLHLHEEVAPDSGKAERSKITGWLQVTMPKVSQLLKPKKVVPREDMRVKAAAERKREAEAARRKAAGEPERLEVGEGVSKAVDVGNIVRDAEAAPRATGLLVMQSRRRDVPLRQNDSDFEDDDDVPPLE